MTMNMRWSLTELYPSFEAELFKKDMEECLDSIERIKEWAKEKLVDNQNPADKLVEYIQMQNALMAKYSRLYSYGSLVRSVDAKNEAALALIEKLQLVRTELTEPSVRFQKWVSKLDNLDSLIAASDVLKEHSYYLKEIVRESKYLLSDKEEVMISKLKNTGSSAWSKLQELLSSTLQVDITLNGEEKKLPLPIVRNLAYDKDQAVRKTAYEAELSAYKKIEESSAACLNGIKGEVITLTKMRGYDSPLAKTLIDSRLDNKVLEAMLTAIQESLPTFRRFYRRKAEILGYQGGLPFYELFAPLGQADLQYTYGEAQEFIVENFRSFSDKLADFAENAFNKQWIDAEPREGKSGGAFCANLHSIGESRILANFTGSFNDVTTLAHELGHGYHGACLANETYLNSGYPMPIAETASIFCETIIKNAALQKAGKEEAFAILENDLSDSGQVIVDIYSRFLFETELFTQREEGSLSVNRLKEAMLKAQKQAYGDGLDSEVLHPYMWVCKPHYYSASSNYYNFPYAFGLLFAKGLYAEYLNRGEAFIKEYDSLLAVTGKLDIADITKIMGIDVRSLDFWRKSLKLIEKDIELFINIK